MIFIFTRPVLTRETSYREVSARQKALGEIYLQPKNPRWHPTTNQHVYRQSGCDVMANFENGAIPLPCPPSRSRTWIGLNANGLQLKRHSYRAGLSALLSFLYYIISHTSRDGTYTPYSSFQPVWPPQRPKIFIGNIIFSSQYKALR